MPFDQIIVVDDGSMDGSLEFLMGRYSQHPVMEIIAQDNQGQLSCFNQGFARTTGEFVFFLDADDLYEPNYVEKTLAMYRRHPYCDFVSCGYRQFGQRDKLHIEFMEDRDLGYSVILAACARAWIGAATSCLSIRRSVLETILPLPFTENWRIRADDCLVFGSSLVGARKYYLAQPLVRRRIHAENHYYGRPPNKFAIYRRRLAINILFEYLERKLHYDVPRLAEFHHREFCTIGRPTFRQLTQYIRIGMATRISLFRRLACAAEMAGYFLRSAIWPAQYSANEASDATDNDHSLPLRLFDPVNWATHVDARPERRQQRRVA